MKNVLNIKEMKVNGYVLIIILKELMFKFFFELVYLNIVIIDIDVFNIVKKFISIGLF